MTIRGYWRRWTGDRKSTRLNSSHSQTSYAVFCLNAPGPPQACPLSLHDALPIFHDRMPVIIPPESYDRWLAAIEPDPRDLLVPFPPEPMTMWPIGPRVNKPENDDPGILEAVDGRSEEHTSELQSQSNLVCRLLLERSRPPPGLPSFPTRRSSDLPRPHARHHPAGELRPLARRHRARPARPAGAIPARAHDHVADRPAGEQAGE